MPKKLHVQDGRAIDLMLDKTIRIGDDSSGYHRPEGDPRPHVAAVEKVLGLLNLMPAEEPPVDLVERTLSRIYSNVSVNGDRSSARPIDPLGPMA